MRFYLNGVDLKDCQIIQNEVGRYYSNGSTYWTTTLDRFDTATPPAGYATYTDGSHKSYGGVSYLYQKALDIRGSQGFPLTCDEPVTVLSTSSSSGSFVKFRVGGKSFLAVHTYKWGTGVVPAGQIICLIAPQSVSKVAPHLHFFGEGFAVRDIILASSDMVQGDKIEWTKDTNIRQGNGLSYPINATASQGAVAILRSSEVRRTDGYDWMDVEHPTVTGWAVVQNMVKTDRAVTNVDGSPVAPPPDPCDARVRAAVEETAGAYQKIIDAKDSEIETLKLAVGKLNSENVSLEKANASLETELRLATERIEKLEQDAKEYIKLLKEANDKIIELSKENEDLTESLAVLREQLAECEKGNNGGCVPFLNLVKPKNDALSE